MIKGLISYLLILLSIIAIFYVGIRYLYAIDETVTSGSAYGFSVGETKIDVYKYIIEHELPESFGYILVGNKADKLDVLTIKQTSYYQLKKYDKWQIIFGDTISFDNTLEIIFSGDKIISLSRRRKI